MVMAEVITLSGCAPREVMVVAEVVMKKLECLRTCLRYYRYQLCRSVMFSLLVLRRSSFLEG